MPKITAILSGLLFAGSLAATETQRLYLSGTGLSDTVDWEFFCTEGRRSGQWTTIPVPSHWELHGFGRYNYGHDEKKSAEEGRYRLRFEIPEAWYAGKVHAGKVHAGKVRTGPVDLVFEGVMTDAEVRVNGRLAGVHQGAFYRFRFDVTELVDYGGENLLEVDVLKQSADSSVNRAERDADYWVFGGIFRPVYLEASPAESIAHVAIDARHDGALRLRARLRGPGQVGLEQPARLTGQVFSMEGEEIGDRFSAEGLESVELETAVATPQAWSAEAPHLYHLRLELWRGDELLHRRSERFGFRTVEVRREEGLFVNGRRVLLKGVNRHAFWPDSGRTLERRLDRATPSSSSR